jgi:CBS domain-containing protein
MTPKRLQNIGELMSKTVIVLQHDEAIVGTVDDFDRFRLRHLPVVQGDRVVGIVTHRELLGALLRRQPGDPSPLASEVMNPDVLTVSPETPLSEALALLITRKTGCLVVVDQDGLAGIVTEYDCVKLARALLP